ncbi:MAG TPA: hypothetical protein VKZ60_08670 [Chloroflexota bacterium]|jgi:hypothetical protein|nr:hypothetical protein [Chloroflexota bacterium]
MTSMANSSIPMDAERPAPRDLAALRAALGRIEAVAREEALDRAPPPPSEQAGLVPDLATAAYQLGLTARLLALGRRAVVARRAGQARRFLLAEVALDLAAARRLLYAARPDDALSVALAALGARDALAAALPRVLDLVTADEWAVFAAVRERAEATLRADLAGGRALEAAAALLLDQDERAAIEEVC